MKTFFLSDKDILLYIFGKVLVFSLESELIGKSIYLTSQKKSYLSLANFHSTGYNPTTPIECRDSREKNSLSFPKLHPKNPFFQINSCPEGTLENGYHLIKGPIQRKLLLFHKSCFGSCCNLLNSKSLLYLPPSKVSAKLLLSKSM